MADALVPYVKDLRADGDSSLQVTNGKIETWDKLKALFNLDVRRDLGWDACPQGKWCWQLVGFEVRTGAPEFIPKVLQTDGKPAHNILVYENWSTAEQPSVEATPPYFTRYVAGWTDSNGVVGFPYSGGGVVEQPGGPFAIWPSNSPPGEEPQYADCAIRLGWLGGTDHLSPNPVFQLLSKSGGGSTPVPPAPGEDVLSNLQAAQAAIAQAIALLVGQAS